MSPCLSVSNANSNVKPLELFFSQLGRQWFSSQEEIFDKRAYEQGGELSNTSIAEESQSVRYAKVRWDSSLISGRNI
jgi:hypothetical protein